MKRASDLRLLAYCTNVHPGETLEAMQSSLSRYAAKVQKLYCPNDLLPIGLWISAKTLGEIDACDLRSWLESRNLLPCTINGFPQGNFHDRIVRHDVYEPTWASDDRLAYTCRLADLLAELHDGEGSISTLPIGWAATTDPLMQETAGMNLRHCARHLAQVESRTGRYVHIDLEPEPGCVLQRSSDIPSWAQRHLLGHGDDELVRRYIRICCDTCHLAVMNEEAADLIDACNTVGLSIGKVQISSALTLDGSSQDDLAALAAIDEPRWLHQVLATEDDGRTSFHDDVSSAMQSPPSGTWNVHFHVPVVADQWGSLRTTQSHTVRSIASLMTQPEIHHWEVETYTWSVLEDDDHITEGIASELAWASSIIADQRSVAP
jgi:hypothetical protein